MSNVDFRLGKRPFYDNKRFRRGFAKSGDFTLAEEDILIRFGDTMSLLESGELSPESDSRKTLSRSAPRRKSCGEQTRKNMGEIHTPCTR